MESPNSPLAIGIKYLVRYTKEHHKSEEQSNWKKSRVINYIAKQLYCRIHE